MGELCKYCGRDLTEGERESGHRLCTDCEFNSCEKRGSECINGMEATKETEIHMESQNKGLGLQVFLTIFSDQLYRRYPTLTDLNQINREDIQSVCQFSLEATPIALELWDQHYTTGKSETRRTVRSAS